MRAVIQRVSDAEVAVGGEVLGRIGQGVVVLLGVGLEDSTEDAAWLADRIARVRIFDGADGDVSLCDIGAEALVVSQFTLHASTKKGTRPSYHRAARPEAAEPLYEDFCAELSVRLGRAVAKGRFGAMMQLRLCNDGPLTLVIDSRRRD
jgi:D-tyrosyl-tRNA(Tyr) deacylase